jgi:hypothetical protein
MEGLNLPLTAQVVGRADNFAVSNFVPTREFSKGTFDGICLGVAVPLGDRDRTVPRPQYAPLHSRDGCRCDA